MGLAERQPPPAQGWASRLGLSFTDADREARYRASHRAWLEPRFLTFAAVVAALFLAFIPVDWLFARDHWAALIPARVGTAMAVLATGLAVHARFPGVRMVPAACVVAVLAYGGVFWSRLVVGADSQYEFTATVMLIQVGVWFLGGVRFVAAALMNLAATAAFLALDRFVVGVPAADVLLSGIYVLALLFVGGFAAWNAERLLRRQFAATEDLERARRECETRAMRDGLTGLWNRQAMDEKLEEACRRSAETGLAGAVMMIDLDRFKPVNDEFGHEAGDDVLIAVSRRIQAVLRIGDSVGRIGGDEFLVLIEELPGDAFAFELAERVRASVEAPIRVRLFGDSVGAHVTVGCSIGICIFHGEAVPPEQIVIAADRELYRNKATRKNLAGAGA